MDKTAPNLIDDYLQNQTPEARETLENIRQTVKAMVPGAQEGISYQIPVIKYLGSPLVGFAAFAKHFGFYVMSLKVMEDFKAELKGFDTSKGTIRFTPASPLPESLVKAIVKARMKELEAAKAASALKKASKSVEKKKTAKPDEAVKA